MDNRFSLTDAMKKSEEQVWRGKFLQTHGPFRKQVYKGIEIELVSTTRTQLHIFKMDKWTSDDRDKGRLMTSWSRSSLCSFYQTTVCSKENDRDDGAERIQFTHSNVTKMCEGK